MATAERITTASQLLRAQGLGRCELVRGELIHLQYFGFKQGLLNARMATALASYVDDRCLGRVVGAKTGYHLFKKPDTVRAPNVSFVRADRVPPRPYWKYFPGAPDLAIEMLSPDDRPGEVGEKVEDWLTAGCTLVWTIDPELQMATRYRPDEVPMTIDITGSLTGEDIVPGFSLSLADLFSWARESGLD